MKNLLSVGFCLLIGLSLVGGCGGNGGSIQSVIHSTTTPPEAAGHLYVSDLLAPGTIYVYVLPIIRGSAPMARIAGDGGPQGMAFDPTGRLFVANTGGVQVFTPPIAGGATPAFVLGGGFAQEVKFDPAGDAFVVETESHPLGYEWCYGFPRPRRVQIYEYRQDVGVYMTPITSSSSANFAFPVTGWSDSGCYGFPSIPVGIAFDASGNLWVNKFSIMAEYTPPFSAASLPNLSFANSGYTGPGGDVAFDSKGNMYATGLTGVDVYKPPFTSSTAKAFTITTMPGGVPDYLAFDASGKLYVGTGAVDVYLPPFSGTSKPAISVLPGTDTHGKGVVVGP